MLSAHSAPAAAAATSVPLLLAHNDPLAAAALAQLKKASLAAASDNQWQLQPYARYFFEHCASFGLQPCTRDEAILLMLEDADVRAWLDDATTSQLFRDGRSVSYSAAVERIQRHHPAAQLPAYMTERVAYSAKRRAIYIEESDRQAALQLTKALPPPMATRASSRRAAAAAAAAMAD